MKTTFLKADKTKYESGDAIFWRGLHGIPMAGTVVAVWSASYDVDRVDGGRCSVRFGMTGLQHATLDQWDDAIKVFTKGHESDWKNS